MLMLLSFFQVRFNAMSTVARVATKGVVYWVTLYRLAYSEDCRAFKNIMDIDGNNLVIRLMNYYFKI